MKSFVINAYNYSELSEEAQQVALREVRGRKSDSKTVWGDMVADCFREKVLPLGLEVSDVYYRFEVLSEWAMFYGTAVIAQMDEEQYEESEYSYVVKEYNEIMKDVHRVLGKEYSLVARISYEFSCSPRMHVSVNVIDEDGDEISVGKSRYTLFSSNNETKKVVDEHECIIRVEKKLKELYLKMAEGLHSELEDVFESVNSDKAMTNVLSHGVLKDAEFYESGEVFEYHYNMKPA